MKNKVFFRNTCTETKEKFFKRVLPGSIYNDMHYSLMYKDKLYDVYTCDSVGMNLGDVCIYRLEEIYK